MAYFPSTTVDTVSLGSVPSLPTVAGPIADESVRYVSHPRWGGGGHSARSFESAETTRLNQAHWRDADDQSVNVWLQNQLATIRARSTYEARQNSTVLGIINTYADDVVGSAGPSLQVISGDDAYNTALECAWRDWFYAPTHLPNVSGVAMLKSWIRSLWKNGEFLARLISLPTDGPISLRVRPQHPRWLTTPIDMTGDPNVFMGIRFDALLGRPSTYYFQESQSLPTRFAALRPTTPVPADLVIHEFTIDEEDQARGIPWCNTGLQPSADLRDYDAQVMDAARLMADQSTLLYSDHPDITPWEVPENSTYERRTIRMAPPAWKPFVLPATQPPVQYPDFRGERMRELGRQAGMPLLMVRMDASGHNYSSARLDTQGYARAVAGVQMWISGGESSYGTLNRLLDEIAIEGRFSIPGLRTRPLQVAYKWTWPTRPHVDRLKEAMADKVNLANQSATMTDVLASRGSTIESHFTTLARENKLKKKAGLVDEKPAEPPGNPGGKPSEVSEPKQEPVNAS